MAIAIPEFPTTCAAEFEIGGVCDILRVGDSFERAYGWDVPDTDPISGNEICEYVPADFTGYTPQAHVLDKNDVILETFLVLPNPGDVTGTFTVSLTPAQVTTALRDLAVRWTLAVTSGSVKRTLIYAPFKIT